MSSGERVKALAVGVLGVNIAMAHNMKELQSGISITPKCSTVLGTGVAVQYMSEASFTVHHHPNQISLGFTSIRHISRGFPLIFTPSSSFLKHSGGVKLWVPSEKGGCGLMNSIDPSLHYIQIVHAHVHVWRNDSSTEKNISGLHEISM